MFDGRLARTVGLALSLGFVPACGSSFDDAPKAQSAEAEPGVFELDDPSGTRLALDGNASKLGFMGAKVTASREGRFLKFDGAAWVEGEQPVAVMLTVETGSMETDAPKLTQHLANEDFLDVPKHPQARFRSTSITAKAGPKGATHEITGIMEIRGQQRQLTFPAEIEIDQGRAIGKARFRFDRQEFGIAYAGKKDDLIRDDALLELDLKFGG